MGTLKLVLVYIMYKTDDLTEEEISCKNMDSMVKYWSHTRIKSGRREIDPENLLIRKPILMVTKNILQIVIAVIISTREALGFWGLRFWPQKKIRFFGCGVFRGLRIFRFSAFGFRFSSKTLSGLRIRYANGFRFLFDLSSNFAPPLISNSCETSVCSICHQCLGSIRVLLTGMWKFIGFNDFASGFRLWPILFLFLFLFFFAVLDYFFYGFAVSNKPQCLPPPQASTTQIIRAMSHREWVTLRRIVLPYFILHAEIACSQRLKTTVHHVSSYILYAGRQLSVFFSHLKSLTEVSILVFWKVLCLPATISPEVLLLCLCVQGQPYDYPQIKKITTFLCSLYNLV